MINELHKSVFKIITGKGTGTGFIVNNQDFIITNHHVVEGNRMVAVEDNKKDRKLAHVVMVNPEVDLAFLQIEGYKNTLDGIQIDPDFNFQNTQKLFINGYPFGMPFTVTEGIISAVEQPMENGHYLQTDAAVNPGNSGGPMLSEDGKLMGVTTSKFNNADNVGFGILLKDLITEIEDYTHTDLTFRVKCNSCGTFTVKKSTFCQECGNSINESVFETFEKNKFVTFIEGALEKLNIEPILCRAGQDFWEFHHGSPLIRIFIYREHYLLLTSPIAKLPKKNIKDLLDYLHSDPYPPFMFGISDNAVYLSFRDYKNEIYSSRASEIKEHIVAYIRLVDDLASLLMDKFGCIPAIESKSIV